MPDRKFSPEKGGGYCAEHLGDARVVEGEIIQDCRRPKYSLESLVYWTTTWSMSKYLFTSKRVLSIVRPFFPIAIALSWAPTSTTTIFLSGLSVTRISLILAGDKLFRIKPSGVSAYSTTSICRLVMRRNWLM